MPSYQLHRCGRLLLAMRGRPALTTAEAASLLGIERATALRDLSALVAADVGVEAVGTGRRRRYRLIGADPLAVTFGQRLALVFGRQMLGFLEGTLIEGWLSELSENLGPALAPGAGATANKLADRLLYIEEPARHYDGHDDTVDAVLTALLKDLELELTYDGRGDIRFRPYTLLVHRRALYLLGDDPERPGLSTLALDRIGAIRVTTTPFRARRGFSAREVMADFFGVRRDPAPERVVLRFPAAKARFVRARRWHRSQEIVDLPDGGVELRMFVGGLELVNLVLDWGRACEVVEPAWLRRDVITELRGALGLYPEAGVVDCDIDARAGKSPEEQER